MKVSGKRQRLPAKSSKLVKTNSRVNASTKPKKILLNNKDRGPNTGNAYDWVFTFGKYKGETFHNVLRKDASYIRWCQGNIDWFNLDKEVSKIVGEWVNYQRPSWHTYGDNRNEGGGYGIWDDAGCHPGDPMDYC